MLKNYIITAIRSFRRNKVFSLVNLLGLSIGLASCIIISVYLIHERSFDRFHSDADRIYRVIEHVQGGSLDKRSLAKVEGALGPFSKSEIAAIEDMVRVYDLGVLNMKRGDKEYGEPFYSFEKNFFSFFDYPLIEGTPESVFAHPKSVVLSESSARRYFGDENAMGKTIEVQTNYGNSEVIVSGIMKDMPENSHLHFDMVFAHETPDALLANFEFLEEYNSNWSSSIFSTYVKTAAGVDRQQVAEAITAMADKNRPEEPGRIRTYSLQSLADIHLQSGDLEGDLNYHEGDSDYIYIFSIVGFIILVIAIANYINLSTIQATDRIKEIGLRRVVGAGRTQLTLQFMSESMFFSLLSFILAFTLIQFVRPFLNGLFEMDIIQLALSLDYLVIVGLVVVFIGLLTGYYPAVVVSRSKMIQALKSQTSGGNKQAFFKGVVAFQFIISLGMIITTIVVYSQINYIDNKDLGYDEEGVALIEINSNQARANEEAILNGFRNIPAVKSAAAVSRVPAEWKSFYEIEVTQESGQVHQGIPYIGVDESFLEVFDIELLRGRNFRPSAQDSLKVLINEKLAKQLGVDVVEGQRLTMTGIKIGADELGLRSTIPLEVIGVIADFHFQSLREEIPPMLFVYKKNPIQNIDYFVVKLQTPDLTNTMLQLKEVIKASDPSPFDYNFLDDKLSRYYEEDNKRSRLFIMASSIAVFIAFIGLYALVHAALQKRVKELGIRKVLGAGAKTLIVLLSKDYLWLLALAMLVASPLAYLGISNWLNDFVYKVEISWWYFALALLICMVITTLATMTQIGKAVNRNPSEVLRQE